MANFKVLKRQSFNRNFDFNKFKIVDNIIANFCEYTSDGKRVKYCINVIQYIETNNHVKTNVERVYESEMYFRTLNAFYQLCEILGGGVVENGK